MRFFIIPILGIMLPILSAERGPLQKVHEAQKYWDAVIKEYAPGNKIMYNNTAYTITSTSYFAGTTSGPHMAEPSSCKTVQATAQAIYRQWLFVKETKKITVLCSVHHDETLPSAYVGVRYIAHK